MPLISGWKLSYAYLLLLKYITALMPYFTCTMHCWKSLLTINSIYVMHQTISISCKISNITLLGVNWLTVNWILFTFNCIQHTFITENQSKQKPAYINYRYQLLHHESAITSIRTTWQAEFNSLQEDSNRDQ